MGQALGAPEPPPLLAGVRRYYDELSLLESVDSGAIAPLRGRWLVEHHKGGGRLLPRRDLPPEAFWSAEELRWLAVKLGDDFGDLFVSVSARWLTADHPDPDGFHLAAIAGVAALYLNMSGGKSLGGPLAFPSSLTATFKAHGLRASATDFALFWDFASLAQPPFANDTEAARFEEGRDLSAVWFGHAKTTVWMQTATPKGFAGYSYEASGWCSTEAALGIAIKPPSRCLDLGARPKTAFDGAYGSAATEPTSTFLIHTCARRHPSPPTTPERMALVLCPENIRALAMAPEQMALARANQKRYAVASDALKVLELYEGFFSSCLCEEARELSFRKHEWRDADLVYLCKEVLPHLSNVTTLDLSGNAFGVAGAEALAAALKKQAGAINSGTTTALTSLDVSGNANMGIYGVNALCEALKQNRTVTSISLLSDGIDDATAAALLELKRQRRAPPLVTLCGLATDTADVNLARMSLRSADAKLIGDEVASSRALTHLHLESNKLGPNGARAIADAVRANSHLSLALLDVSGNGLGAEGAKAIADVLRETRSLTSLLIESNKMGDEGVAALADALRQNEHPILLASLDLSGNDISARGAKALATALKDEDGVAGKWLTWLDLKYNDLGEEGEAAVREAIEVVAERYEAEIDPDLRELEL